MVDFWGITHPVVGEIPGWYRVFYTKDLSADSLFSDSNNSGLHDTTFAYSGGAICIRQIENLTLFEHSIFSAGNNGLGFAVDSFDKKVDFGTKHIAEDLILSINDITVV